MSASWLNDNRNSSAHFEVVTGDEAVGSDLLGFWTLTVARPENVSYGQPDLSTTTVWRAHLPADSEQAATLLTEAHAQLWRTDRALDDASRRLGAVVRAPGAEPSRRPEAELLALLHWPTSAELTNSVKQDRW